MIFKLIIHDMTFVSLFIIRIVYRHNFISKSMKLSYHTKHIIRLSILLSILGGIIIFIYIQLVNDQQITMKQLQNIKFDKNEQQKFIQSVDESGGHQIQQTAIKGALENNQQITIDEIVAVHNLV